MLGSKGIAMLEIAQFIAGLAGMLGQAFHKLGGVAADQRKRQSQYLDDVSATLAAAAAAVAAKEDLTKYFSELRFHLGTINDVLRLGDPDYLMSMSDDTVQKLQAELDAALEKTAPSIIMPKEELMSSDTWVAREDLKDALLNASGVFRGASVALSAANHHLEYDP